MAEISKSYEARDIEKKWYAAWQTAGAFAGRVVAGKEPYTIVIPPPNVTGVLTMGHVLNNTLQDVLIRRARLEGRSALWVPGTDHAGIATQTVVERELRKEKKHRRDLGREKFLEKVWAWRTEKGGIILEQLRRLGASCDWDRTQFTMDPHYSQAVLGVFVDLFKKGHIYRGKRMVNWCPASQTALSDEEVIMKPVSGAIYHVRYEIVGRPGEFVSVKTTRPETIPGDVAIAVHPDDPRYTALLGKKVRRALGPAAEIPIIADAAVDKEFGTGALKITPAHDKADFEIGGRHHLPAIDVLEADGKLNAFAGPELAGLDRFAGRKKAVELLKASGALVGEEPHANNVGYSERADVPIEPRLTWQWWLKYPRIEEAKTAVRDGHITFHPARWSKVYLHWLENIQDWCISRQLWWGHRIPVWYNGEAHAKAQQTVPIVELSGHELAGTTINGLRDAAWEYAGSHALLNHAFPNAETGWDIVVRPASLEHAFTHHGAANIKAVVALPELIRTAIKVGSLDHLPVSTHFKAVHLFVAAARIGGELFRVKITVKEHIDGQKLYDHQLFKKETPDGESPTPDALANVSTRPTSGAVIRLADLVDDVNSDVLFTRCQIDSPGPGWEQDPDVLDTWFSSWLWPFATMGWPDADKMKAQGLDHFYPTTTLVTGPDIIFFWVARMIMAGLEFTRPGEPLERRIPFKHVYFTGIIRDAQGRKMSKSLGNSPDPLDLIDKYGADGLRFGIVSIAPQGQDIRFQEERIEGGKNFCNKLWNACRFRQMSGEAGDNSSLSAIMARLVPAQFDADDHAILDRLLATTREVDRCFREFEFSAAVQALYAFFWGDFCDWYVEVSKSRLQSPDAKGNCLAIQDLVLRQTLLLLHPFIPFITEELWHLLGYGLERKFIEDAHLDNASQVANTGALHGLVLNQTAAASVERLKDFVSKARALKAEHNLASRRDVKLLVTATAADWKVLETNLAKLTRMCGAASTERREKVDGAPAVVAALGTIYLDLASAVDAGAEKVRLTKELDQLAKHIAGTEARLSNEAFVSKAPPAVLEGARKQLADQKAKRAELERLLKALG
jgi:valyl-tRNA synthetase